VEGEEVLRVDEAGNRAKTPRMTWIGRAKPTSRNTLSIAAMNRK
jgi:hypothetical protein